MATAPPKQKITPEQLARIPDSVGFELIDGELVERNVTVLSGLVAGMVLGKLWAHCKETNTALAWPPSLGCRCFPNAPDNVRKADVVVVRRDRFLTENYRDEFLAIRPDLIVEVISAKDTFCEVADKVEAFLSIGVPLVWIVNPRIRTVEINRPDSTVTRLRAGDEITGENVLPGFRCRVAEFFPAEDQK